MPPVLTKLCRRGYPLVTISNIVAPPTDAVKNVLTPWMDDFVLSCDVGACKADPTPFHEAARQLEVPLHRILMVGDSQRGDTVSATAVGMPAIHVDGAGNGRVGMTDLPPLPEWLPGIAATRNH